MSKSKIEWTESTWNPTTGCTKVSAGCKHCYAETMSFRLKAMGTPGYDNGFEFSLMPERLNQPFKIKKPTRFFVNSMSDLFHEEMPYEYLDKVFEVMEQTPRHEYQILTKREHILADYFKDKKAPKNVWLGVTVENKKSKNRINILRNINATVRFLSLEPLLEDLGALDLSNIHWAIVGGESGNKARPMDKEWAINIKNQCLEQNTKFFFKQWGTWGSDNVKRSKKANGRLLEGEEWNEYPALELV